MKFFKLIKSIDYVTYPTYKELVKISDAVSNSITSFRDLLISTIVGVLFEITPISTCITTLIQSKYPNTIIGNVAAYKNAPLIISIMIAIILLGIIKLGKFIYTRWGSNKNTKKKRDIIVYEFYNIAIPQLIEVKSIVEQINEDESGERRKKLLLLLQAKYEVQDLYQLISEMNIIEHDHAGSQTENSSTLHDRISRCAYCTFLNEMLEIMETIYNELNKQYKNESKSDIEDIRATINSTGVFDEIEDTKSQWEKITAKINSEVVAQPR